MQNNFKIEMLAPAKINLFLEVINRRNDGYHNIKTIMQTVSLFDRIVIEPSEKLILKCDNPDLPVNEKNLALKAAYILKKELGIDKGAKIILEKRIPLGAGLGGGSSDAAAVLKGLLKLWKKRVPVKKLIKIASGIGADVPFFLSGGTALAEGIGDKIEHLSNIKPAFFVLVYPGFQVSTPWVYQNLQFPLTTKQKINRIKQLLVTGSLSTEWDKYLFNRLEEVVLPKYRRIEQVKNILSEAGCQSLMSGSGSTVFGVVESLDEGEQIISRLKKLKCQSWLVKSVY